MCLSIIRVQLYISLVNRICGCRGGVCCGEIGGGDDTARHRTPPGGRQQSSGADQDWGLVLPRPGVGVNMLFSSESQGRPFSAVSEVQCGKILY